DPGRQRQVELAAAPGRAPFAQQRTEARGLPRSVATRRVACHARRIDRSLHRFHDLQGHGSMTAGIIEAASHRAQAGRCHHEEMHMTTLSDQAARLHALHRGERPLVVFNIWDPGSAKAVADAGAAALATGSWSVAAAHGYVDGEQFPLEQALSNLARI